MQTTSKSMTGRTALLLTLAAAATACAPARVSPDVSDPGLTGKSAAASVTLGALAGTTWIAEDIDQAGVIDRLQSRLQFVDGSSVGGMAGCNSFSGPAASSGAEFRLGPFATTRKSCVLPVMDQESRFLAALAQARTARTAHGLLYLYDAGGRTVLRLARLEPQAATYPDALPGGLLHAYVWQCSDGQTLVMRNLLSKKAISIDLDDGERRLEQTMSASGARYADAGEAVVFWTKGDSATLERAGSAAVQCRERRADSLREDARVRGVTYRALGNEPGWILEIGPQTRLTWITDYGAERHDFKESVATITAGSASYTAGRDPDAITATFRAERCIDDGEVAYDHTATIVYRGRTYRGCANRLADD